MLGLMLSALFFPDPKTESPWVLAVRILLLAGMYFLGAKLGLYFATVGGNVTLIWPPTGLSLAALLFYGIRLWPGVALGAGVAALATHTGWPFVLMQVIGNTLEAVAGFWLLGRVGFDVRMERLKDVLALFSFGATLRTCSTSFQKQGQESEVNELQAGVERAFAVFP